MSRVSVLIPVHNAERFLREAIASAVNQTRPVHEIVIVNDGSTDGTAEIARGWGAPVRFIDRPKLGLSRIRNLAVRESTGDFLAFLDSDDRWTPDRVELALAAFEQEPELDMVFAHMRQFRQGEDPAAQPAKVAVLPGAVMMRRSAFERVGPFDESYHLAEFLDWLMRAREIPLREKLLPQTLLHRRIHDRNIGVARTEEKYLTFLRSIKAGLQRRRADAS